MLNPRLKENKLKRALVSPFRNLIKVLNKKLYVRLQYRYITHHACHLNHPVRYTEKLQHLRLYEYAHSPLVSQCASRGGLREYAKKLGLESYLVPCLGIYSSFDEIPFDTLPDQFVMKCTHASGFNYLCYDKNKMDKEAVKARFDKWLKTDYGRKTAEPHYSKIHPQIIIEEMLVEKSWLPVEYKIHVFNGKAKYMYVVTSRNKDIRYNNYYIDWRPFDGAQFNGWNKSMEKLTPPENWDEMVKIAEALAAPFPFVRVDLYNINGKIYISEMTFTPAKGTLIFDDDHADFEIGEWLHL